MSTQRIPIDPASPLFQALPLFEGFPYLITRVVPVLYHILPLSELNTRDELITIGRNQVIANRMQSSVVLGPEEAYPISEEGSVGERSLAPRGGIILCGRLAPGVTPSPTADFQRREAELEVHVERENPGGYMNGDSTYGARRATLMDRVRFSWRIGARLPAGLSTCETCGKPRGEHLWRSPEGVAWVRPVHCDCGNWNRCARCGESLNEDRLNGNYYRREDRQVWHTPGESPRVHRRLGDVSVASSA